MIDRATTGSSWHGTYYLGLLARSLGIAGQEDESHAVLSEALEIADGTGERWYECELHRMFGEWHAARGDREHAEAEARFGRALNLARDQRAKMWELRAALSLGGPRDYEERGCRNEQLKWSFPETFPGLLLGHINRFKSDFADAGAEDDHKLKVARIGVEGAMDNIRRDED